MPRPASAEQRGLWLAALGGEAHPAEEAGVRWPRSSAGARATSPNLATLRDAGQAGALWQPVATAPARLAELAQRSSRADWDDLVPESQKQLLAQIVVHMQRRFRSSRRLGLCRQGDARPGNHRLVSR